MDLNTRAVMFRLETGGIGESRKSKDGAGIVASAKNGNAEFFRVSLRLIPSGETLRFKSPRAKFVQRFNTVWTLPIGHKGQRIGFLKSFTQIMAEYRQAKAEADAGLAEFIAELPRIRREVQMGLGDDFDPNAFPTAQDVADAYRFELRGVPIVDLEPMVQEMMGLTDEMKSEFIASVRKEQESRNEAMVDGLVRRIAKTVNRLKEQMAADLGRDENARRPKWQQSLLDNVGELVDAARGFLPLLSNSDAGRFDSLLAEIETGLANRQANVVKDDVDAQIELHENSTAVLDRLCAWTGASLSDLVGGADED